MHRPFSLIVAFGAMSVASLCHAQAALPAPEQSRFEGTLYGGAGSSRLDSNEGGPDTYDERHFGFGILWSLRPWNTSPGEPVERDAVGWVLRLGLSSELRAHKLVTCHYDCTGQNEGFIGEEEYGARLGVGYDSRVFGLRGGVLFADGVHARMAEALPFPDVELRAGSRDWFFITVGLGAYDASTSLRPGLYLSASIMAVRGFTLSFHYGAHAGVGTFGHTVTQIGGRADLGGNYALSRKISVGAGTSLQNPSGMTLARGMWEVRTLLALAQ